MQQLFFPPQEDRKDSCKTTLACTHLALNEQDSGLNENIVQTLNSAFVWSLTAEENVKLLRKMFHLQQILIKVKCLSSRTRQNPFILNQIFSEMSSNVGQSLRILTAASGTRQKTLYPVVLLAFWIYYKIKSPAASNYQY